MQALEHKTYHLLLIRIRVGIRVTLAVLVLVRVTFLFIAIFFLFLDGRPPLLARSLTLCWRSAPQCRHLSGYRV